MANGLRQLELPSALEFLRTAREQHPGSFWFNVILGRELQAAGSKEAITYFRIAVALRPESGWTYLPLGDLLGKEGDLDGETAAFRRAIELEPSSAAAHSDLGLSLIKQGDLEGAIAACRRAIELDRNSRRTIDSIDYVAERHADGPILLVTQPFHMSRALFLARSRGLDAWGLIASGPAPGLRIRLRESIAELRAVLDLRLSRRGK